MASTLITSNFTNVSSKYVARKGTQTVQEQVVEYINEHNPQGTILNYGSLDIGVYLTAHQIPVFRHFESQNFAYEKYSENADEQNRYINEHLAYFVVVPVRSDQTIDDKYEANPTLKTDYNVVLCEKYKIQSTDHLNEVYNQTLYLFELKAEFTENN